MSHVTRTLNQIERGDLRAKEQSPRGHGASAMAGKTSKMSAEVATKSAKKRAVSKPKLLSGGNPQIAAMHAHSLTQLAGADPDFDRVPGLTRYAPV